MAQIIVTGGSGFLGKQLCRELVLAGHSVLNIDLRENQEQQTILADVRDASAMLASIRDADAVFHLASLIEAGESVLQPQKYIDWNISGTLNVLEAMRVNGIKHFLFSSSAAIYGDPISTPIAEDDRTLPVNPYGMTKLGMEALLSSYVKAFGFTGTALRYFNLYGPEEHHMPETHAIPRFIAQMQEGQPVSVYGDGGHIRDFIYIQDVVDAHLVALQYSFDHYGQYHYFNISTGIGETVGRIVEKLASLLQVRALVDHQPERAGDPRVLLADPSKAQAILGWHAQVALDDGLEKTVQYFQKHPISL